MLLLEKAEVGFVPSDQITTLVAINIQQYRHEIFNLTVKT